MGIPGFFGHVPKTQQILSEKFADPCLFCGAFNTFDCVIVRIFRGTCDLFALHGIGEFAYKCVVVC